MSGRLDGKVVLVTGAGRGFGAGIAVGLARAGAHVCLTDVNAQELALSAEEVQRCGGQSLSLLVDVRRLSALESAIGTCVDHWGRIDAVISNAAILPLLSFAETTPEWWQRILDVNLNGVYNGARAAWPHFLRQGGGHLIAIASGASVRGSFDETAYVAAKHAVEGFTKALAMEAEPFNIAVNTVGPGAIIKPTNITRDEEAQAPEALRQSWADPAALASAFVWLINQPPQRFTGLRFDAAPLAATIAAEGYDFTFEARKATLYVDDFVARQQRRGEWTSLK
jgi:2-dehydro-3-deoxy-D-gluconate 5-dehydrogenase